MATFDVCAFLSGILKGLPAVALSFASLWVLIKFGKVLEKRHVLRIFRIAIMVLLGMTEAWVVALAVYLPYGGGMPGVPALCVTSFLFYAFLQMNWMKQRQDGLKDGSPAVNRRYLIGFTVALAIALGLYGSEPEGASGIILLMTVWISFIVMSYYIILYFSVLGEMTRLHRFGRLSLMAQSGSHLFRACIFIITKSFLQTSRNSYNQFINVFLLRYGK